MSHQCTGTHQSLHQNTWTGLGHVTSAQQHCIWPALTIHKNMDAIASIQCECTRPMSFVTCMTDCTPCLFGQFVYVRTLECLSTIPWTHCSNTSKACHTYQLFFCCTLCSTLWRYESAKFLSWQDTRASNELKNVVPVTKSCTNGNN